MSVTMRTLAVSMTFVLAVAAGRPALAAGAQVSDSSEGGNGALREVRALIAEGRFDEALAELEEVVARDEGSADAWNLVGFSYRKLGKHDLALDGYSRALAIDPRHTEALEYLGELYLALDDLERAKQQLAKLEEICHSGCEELEELKEGIARYEAAKGE